MALKPYTLIVDGRLRLTLQLDHEDQAQRDVLAHFSQGQMYEHETSLLFVRTLRPGDTVIDVGGNAGYFSMLAAALVGPQGRVVTAEANPRLVALIRETAAMNGAGHVQVEAAAVSDHNGQLIFSANGDHDSNGGVAPGKAPGDALLSNENVSQFVAQATTLDALAARCGLDHIRLVKIDTEGHELQVLRGAAGLLAAGRIDFIAAEMNLMGLPFHGADQHQLRAYALGHGYHTFLLDHEGGLPRLVPPGVTLEQPYTCNALFARLESLPAVWPTVLNTPAILRAVKPA